MLFPVIGNSCVLPCLVSPHSGQAFSAFFEHLLDHQKISISISSHVCFLCPQINPLGHKSYSHFFHCFCLLIPHCLLPSGLSVEQEQTVYVWFQSCRIGLLSCDVDRSKLSNLPHMQTAKGPGCYGTAVRCWCCKVILNSQRVVVNYLCVLLFFFNFWNPIMRGKA